MKKTNQDIVLHILYKLNLEGIVTDSKVLLTSIGYNTIIYNSSNANLI
jgi:hypothetical protein